MSFESISDNLIHARACGCAACSGFIADWSDGESFEAYRNADARGGFVGDKESFTVSQAAWQIIRGEPGWGSMGQPFTVSYAFRASEPSKMPDDTSGFSRFNAQQIAQTELALAAWSDVARITFVRVGSGNFGEGAYSNSATMLFGNYSSGASGASAFAYYPGNTAHGSPAGDVWINATLGSNGHPVTGNYGAHVLTHEIGHAIGLAHPSEYNSVSGSSNTYSGQARYAEDTRQFTVMSYFSEFNSGGNFGGLYAAAPLLDDIAAAQLMYGANMTTRLGDTVYGFNSNADRPWFEAASNVRVVFAVWDAGGKDTFDFSGYVSNAIIDLRPGHFSSVGGLVGNVAIAIGTDIEDAIGGAGHDTIHGNALENWLRGGAGNDVIYGGGGWDYLHGNQGDDTLFGGDGGDWVVGGQGNDLLHGENGDDLMFGHMGADTAYGGPGNDTILGGQGDDHVHGGEGDDWLGGDRGNDTLWGGPGADTFRAFNGSGIDRIMDFSRAEGDVVLLEAISTYSVAQVGADVVVSFGSGDQVILANVNVASLTPGWIIAG